MCIQRPEPNDVEADIRCEHGRLIPYGWTDAECCDDCNENLGAEQAEGSVGK